MFADLNTHAVRPSQSLGVLYDHRDELADLVRTLISDIFEFSKIIDTEKTGVSKNSKRLFTLHALYHANKALLQKVGYRDISEDTMADVLFFWKKVCQAIPLWGEIAREEVSSAEARERSIAAHSVILQSLGVAGSEMIGEGNIVSEMEKLNDIDWSRDSAIWQSRTMVKGRISKSDIHLTLTTNYIKSLLGLSLSEKEAATEKEHIE